MSFPDSVGERHRFIWIDFGPGERAIVRPLQLDGYIRASDGAGTLLRLHVIAADQLCTIRLASVAMGPHVSPVRAAEGLLAPIACVPVPVPEPN